MKFRKPKFKAETYYKILLWIIAAYFIVMGIYQTYIFGHNYILDKQRAVVKEYQHFLGEAALNCVPVAVNTDKGLRHLIAIECLKGGVKNDKRV